MVVVLVAMLGGPIGVHYVRGAVRLRGGRYWDLSSPIWDQIGAVGFRDCGVCVYNGSTGIRYVGATRAGDVGWVDR